MFSFIQSIPEQCLYKVTETANAYPQSPTAIASTTSIVSFLGSWVLDAFTFGSGQVENAYSGNSLESRKIQETAEGICTIPYMQNFIIDNEKNRVDFEEFQNWKEKQFSGKNSEYIHSCLQSLMNEYIPHIADIGPLLTADSDFYQLQNSAKTAKELVELAQIAADPFIENINRIAAKLNAKVSFGPNDAFVTKTYDSLLHKVKMDCNAEKITEEESVAKIGDALRGTIIVSTPQKIPFVCKEISRWIEEDFGGKAYFKNTWIERRVNGYPAVHARIWLPIEEKKDRAILAEIQIHLTTINNGTPSSAKEKQHKIYKNPDMVLDPDSESQAIYLYALCHESDYCLSLDQISSKQKNNFVTPRTSAVWPNFLEKTLEDLKKIPNSLFLQDMSE
ncbi:MAG: hypothetical protein CMO81_10020 [Waddliaceae bacterium]|nr:hypothetical protein [Waddliaceae bacterium]